MNKLLQILNSIHPLSKELTTYISKAFEYLEVKKGEYILKEGQTCEYLYFIDQGLVRCFEYQKQKEICRWFQTEDNTVISFDSFFTQTPGKEYIEALEDCKLYRISYANLYYMYDNYIETNKHRAVLYEKYYRLLWKCFDNIRLTSARERYQFFIENFPHWVNRVPKKDIAAFLGITPEHLSRVRV